MVGVSGKGHSDPGRDNKIRAAGLGERDVAGRNDGARRRGHALVKVVHTIVDAVPTQRPRHPQSAAVEHDRGNVRGVVRVCKQRAPGIQSEHGGARRCADERVVSGAEREAGTGHVDRGSVVETGEGRVARSCQRCGLANVQRTGEGLIAGDGGYAGAVEIDRAGAGRQGA